MSDNKRITLMSYMPLVYGTGAIVDNLNVDEFSEMIAQVAEERRGTAKACLWIGTEDGVCPVLVYENAAEIADHLLLWCEDKPEKWFIVHIAKYGDGYKIILAPDLDQSIARWKYHHDDISHKYDKKEFLLITSPLRFMAEHSDLYSKIKDLIPAGATKIGIMDIEDLNRVEDEPECVRWIGPIKLGDEDDISHILMD
jgi:hypothetical protein